jgi:hypothetical protein
MYKGKENRWDYSTRKESVADSEHFARGGKKIMYIFLLKKYITYFYTIYIQL